MRQLTKSQKKLIDRELKAEPNLRCWDDLETEVMEELEEINNTEILYQEVNNYIQESK
jgi:hypothetical protein